MTTVTDADREAYLAFNTLPPDYAAAVRAGTWDKLTGLQVLARHRQAAEERARLEGIAMGIEAAKKALKTANGVSKAALWDVNHVLGTLSPAAILAQHKRTKEET